MAKKGKLTEKQQRFVDEYLIDLNATQAAIRAGYSVKTADAIGCENLTKPNIQQAIAEHMAERSRRTGVNQDRVVLELAKIAFVRMTDVVDSNGRIKQDASADDLSCIESIKYKESDNEFGGSVVEVEARFAEDGKDHVIYWYVDRVDKEGHRIKKIMDWDDEQVVYYVQTDEGEIQLDDKAKVNPRPHILYQVDGDDNTYIDSLGFLPFFRLDNNKKQFSNLKAVKDLIDDYDLMASSLSNNLIDFDHPLYAVKGFEGDNLDELQQNLKTKKIVGVGSDGGIEVHTVDVPYEARKVKLELDEKNIYRFGMGLNLSGLKDTSATTNIAIKAAYSLLDLRCKHLERNIKRFLRKIVAVCIDEINQQNGTDYQITDVYFEFTHEVMSNEQENEQNELTEAQKQQVQINTLLSLAQIFGDDLTIQYICVGAVCCNVQNGL